MNSFTKIRSLILKASAFTALAAPALIQSGVAHAEGNFTAGAICRATAGGVVAYNNFAEIVNIGSTVMHVVCPIDRTSFGPAGTSFAGLSVTDNNTTSNVNCAINSKDPTGSSFTFGTGSSSGTNTNISVNMSTFHITNSDYTWVSCDLPPVQSGAKSSLQSFITFEF